MTLNTTIGLIGNNLDFDHVIEYANELIGAKHPIYSIRTSEEHPDVQEYDNQPGQGFDALLTAVRSKISKNSTNNVWTEEVYGEEEGTFDPIAEIDYGVNIRLDFDTPYGYKHPVYGRCATFHAMIVKSFVEYMQQRGGKVIWKNEYASTIHEGVDGLDKFLGNGKEASLWFDKHVKGCLTPSFGTGRETTEPDS